MRSARSILSRIAILIFIGCGSPDPGNTPLQSTPPGVDDIRIETREIKAANRRVPEQ